MYVSAGVGGVAAVLPGLELRFQSHYFLDTPRIIRVCNTKRMVGSYWCVAEKYAPILIN